MYHNVLYQEFLKIDTYDHSINTHLFVKTLKKLNV